jgi:hypothetical protein
MRIRPGLALGREAWRLAVGALRSVGRTKVFCVGRNKTGATSMAAAFADLGLVVGRQAWAERLAFDWARRDFRRLFRYCLTAQAFQDGRPFPWANRSANAGDAERQVP